MAWVHASLCDGRTPAPDAAPNQARWEHLGVCRRLGKHEYAICSGSLPQTIVHGVADMGSVRRTIGRSKNKQGGQDGDLRQQPFKEPKVGHAAWEVGRCLQVNRSPCPSRHHSTSQPFPILPVLGMLLNRNSMSVSPTRYYGVN